MKPNLADLTDDVLAPEDKPTVHRRDRSGVASCGTPARQDQLVDDLEFDCRACWRAVQSGARS
jgi:hypothetical protein